MKKFTEAWIAAESALQDVAAILAEFQGDSPDGSYDPDFWISAVGEAIYGLRTGHKELKIISSAPCFARGSG